jgi:4-diphosphocytidyl-2-C-methyl-D-erythritol kinase
MRVFLINSYCKINISLRVIKKLKNGLHKINTFITFARIFDQIYLKEIKNTKDKISFYGKFKNKISKSNNTISRILDLLRKNNFIKKIYFEIKVKKNIPTKSGLGGGSMNAASLLTFLVKKYNLRIKQKDLFKLAAKVGSDVIVGLKFQNVFFNSGSNTIKRYKNKLNLFVLLVKPNVNCSTKLIYSKNRQFSKQYKNKDISKFRNFFEKDVNDLEKVAFKIYPKIKRLKDYLNIQKKCIFSRMTGSGSVCVAYFKDYKAARKAEINLKNKFPNYWCKLSKAM